MLYIFLMLLGVAVIVTGVIVNRQFELPHDLRILPTVVKTFGAVVMIVSFASGMFYMQEPRYNTFVRDITGNTYANFTTGWHVKGFGTVVKVKKELSIALAKTNTGNVSFIRPLKNAVFLDNVTANIGAAIRITTPITESGLRNAISSFGTVENAVQSIIIPSIERTIVNTTGLMTAERYFAGGKTEFMNEFDNQMRHGLYVVKLKEFRVNTLVQDRSNQDRTVTGDGKVKNVNKVVLIAAKVLDPYGAPVTMPQDFMKYGFRVSAAIISTVVPNPQFMKRMRDKQNASAALAVSKENIKKEESLKVLAVVIGERSAAQARSVALKVQAGKTTKADTDKRLAIIEANKILETTKIQLQTAVAALQRDEIKSKSIKVLADADAYSKRVVIEANGALELKLNAYKYAVNRMASAIEKRKVPNSLVIMGGTGGTGSNGSDLAGASSSIETLLSVIAAKSAKDLSLDLRTK